MSMFTKYQNPYGETPNNLYKVNTIPQSYTSKLNATELSEPYELYNTKGELEGYYWYYGDTVNLEFNIDGEVTLENDAIVYKHRGYDPNELNAAGIVGQRCYNVIDLRSWTCVAISNKIFTWEEDLEFTYPSYGKSVFIGAEDYLKGKTATITLYNFRFEAIYQETSSASVQPRLVISKDLSKQMTKGIYYCSLEVSGPSMHQSIFSPQDCKLLVK